MLDHPENATQGCDTSRGGRQARRPSIGPITADRSRSIKARKESTVSAPDFQLSDAFEQDVEQGGGRKLR